MLNLRFFRIRHSFYSLSSAHITIDGRPEHKSLIILARSPLNLSTHSKNFLWHIELSSFWNVILPKISPVFTICNHKSRITYHSCSLENSLSGPTLLNVPCSSGFLTPSKSHMLKVSQYYHFSKNNQKQIGANKGTFT
jgi:hypothetical protein